MPSAVLYLPLALRRQRAGGVHQAVSNSPWG
uniref:Uncharacterized protein n=1 Tax=Podoviridae sp. ctnCN2 TaxID=2825274 RepID=A0A8S5PKI9_9CAUD|nr:MAG TPA: hypothetical protein [Podoviridae sp. ctnCN2]DAU94256.1 MAG TPA: hypothetical protein [Caudoviricetes sp.]